VSEKFFSQEQNNESRCIFSQGQYGINLNRDKGNKQGQGINLDSLFISISVYLLCILLDSCCA